VCRGLADLLIDPDVREVGLLSWRELEKTAEAAYAFTRAEIEARGISYAALLESAAPPG
jgi:hypothetical protein